MLRHHCAVLFFMRCAVLVGCFVYRAVEVKPLAIEALKECVQRLPNVLAVTCEFSGGLFR